MNDERILSLDSDSLLVVETVDCTAAAATAGSEIRIQGGTFSTDNAPTFNGVATTISGGNFSTSVCGGKFYTQSGETLTLVKPSIGSSGSEA